MTTETETARPAADHELVRRKIAEAHALRAAFLRDALGGLLRRLHLVRPPVQSRTAGAAPRPCTA